MEDTHFDDYTDFEGEHFSPDDADLDLSFLLKLKTSEVVPGITKYELKRPKVPVTVLPDSHIGAEVVHRTAQGEFMKGLNNNWATGRKLKLGGLNDRELVLCVKTMCPDEIAYFKIDRDIIDKTDDPNELLTDVEKKRKESGKLRDGYYRIRILEETKVKTNLIGVPLNLENQLKAIQDNKAAGNELFRRALYKDAIKEYLKGFNQSTCFPLKRAEDEGKTKIVEDLKAVRIDLINNCLRAAFKAKDYSKIDPLFDSKVLKEMEYNLKFCVGLTEIYLQIIEDDNNYVDVDDIIVFITKFLEHEQDKLEESTKIDLAQAIKKLERYEKKFNVLQNLKHYSKKRDELEYAEKVAEKLEERGELGNSSEGSEEETEAQPEVVTTAELTANAVATE